MPVFAADKNKALNAAKELFSGHRVTVLLRKASQALDRSVIAGNGLSSKQPSCVRAAAVQHTASGLTSRMASCPEIEPAVNSGEAVLVIVQGQEARCWFR